METRKEVVINMFYPGDKNTLEKLILSYLNEVKLTKNTEGLKAVVSPHAGYIYSGKTAAYSYKSIENNWDKIPHTFIILGPSHYEYFSGVSVGMYDYYSTPLGDIEVDKKLGEKFIKKYPEIFNNLVEPQLNEHSIEVQLPFLKYISKGRDFKILPMVIGETNPVSVGKILSEIKNENDFFIIVSTDLSHYKGYNEAINKDKKTLKTLIKKNSNEIITLADACGLGPCVCLNEIASINNWNTELLDYKNSGDVSGNKDKVVGYASLIYKK